MTQEEQEPQPASRSPLLLALVAGAIVLVLIAVSLVALNAGGMLVESADSNGIKISAAARRYANLEGDAARGDKAFHGTCSACHGNDATGIVGIGKNLVISTFLNGLSDADFVLFVTKGRPASNPANTTMVDMPPRGGNPALRDQDLADVVAYVRSLQRAAK